MPAHGSFDGRRTAGGLRSRPSPRRPGRGSQARGGPAAGRRHGRLRPPVTSPENYRRGSAFPRRFRRRGGFCRRRRCCRRRRRLAPGGGSVRSGVPANGRPQRHGTLVIAAAATAVALVSAFSCVCFCLPPRLSVRMSRRSILLCSSCVCSPPPDPPRPPRFRTPRQLRPFSDSIMDRRAMMLSRPASRGTAPQMRPKHCSVDRGDCLVRSLRPV